MIWDTKCVDKSKNRCYTANHTKCVRYLQRLRKQEPQTAGSFVIFAVFPNLQCVSMDKAEAAFLPVDRICVRIEMRLNVNNTYRANIYGRVVPKK